MFVFCGLVLGQSAPIISTISPTSGAQGEVLSLTIFGSGFVATPTLDMGAGISVGSVTFLTPSLITATITISASAPVGPHDVIVTNPDGLADTLFGGFSVLPESDPPEAHIIFPPSCTTFVACEDTMIIIRLHDENGIDDTTLVLSVGGVDYTISDPELVLLGDTLLYFIPSAWFSDGDTVDVTVVRVADTFGNVATNPLRCRFVVDESPPAISECEPPMYSSCRDLVPTILMPICDSISGVDSTTFVVTIVTPEGDTLTYSWGSATLRWLRDTLIWEASVAGLSFEEEETVWICLSAGDLVPSSTCGPNVLDTCWYIYFHVPPPLDVSLTIDRIYTDQFPLVSAFCLVLDEEERTIEGLDEENFMVWEDYGSGWELQYPDIVQSLGGGGMVDIVFCVDTTGSMSGMIGDVRAGLDEFTDSLAVAGISYRLGLVLFSDYVEFWYGYDLTGDLATFDSWVAGLTSGGGGDWAEVSLDAINDALDSMHFRPGATIVIIMVTDAPPHTLGDGTTYSDVTVDMVLSNLLAHRAMCFIVSSYDDPAYHTLTDGTGGAFFDWSGPGDFALILPLIAEAVRGGYIVSWTSAHPYADCQTRNVRIRVDCYDLYDVDNSNYLAPCSPAAAIVEPLPNTWTSDPLQRIIMTFAELEDSINPSSIQFMVDGIVYNTYMPSLTYSDPYLTWTHTYPFTNAQRVNAELVRVMDYQGNLPFSGPVRWHFYVDLAPPRIANQSPAPGEVITDHQPRICFDIWDEESGLNIDALLVAIDCRQSRDSIPPILVTLDRNSPGVTIDGTKFCWDPAAQGFVFWDRDTVCVTVVRAEDSPDYGQPNELPDSLRRWCFYIPDDDTLCPEFSQLAPDSTLQLTPSAPFFIQADICDPSGVSVAWVEWDTDGDLDDGTANIAPLTNVGGNTFRTDEEIPGQSELSDFVYRVCACDADADNGDPYDSSCCCSEIMPLYFGQGPQVEIIEPLPFTVTTNSCQPIILRIWDDEAGVDPSTIVLRVEGSDYTVDGVELIYSGDTLYFIPQPGHCFADGESVSVELVSALDNAGNGFQGHWAWKFFVDLTPPYVEGTDPIDGQIILDDQYDVVFDLADMWRRVDSSSVELELFDRTLHWGDAGLLWDPELEVLRFIPENASPPFHFPNGDTVCAILTCADIPPDYGEPNYMRNDTVMCFVYAITACDCRPTLLTPNGDGINDVAYFEYPDMIYGNGIIHIYDTEGEEIYTSPPGATTWDCRSSTGAIVRGGLYIYMIEVNGETVCSGTVTVIR